MRLLGVDFGERRVGVAVSDPTGLIARPWGVVTRTSNRQAADDVAALARELDAEAVVLGLPLDTSGEEGFQARRVRRFAALLKERLAVPLILWDESYTSVDASEIIRQQGRGKKGRRRFLDDVAAAVLLQGYLDAHRPSAPRP